MKSYDRMSQIFHWVTAIIVPIAFLLGPGGFGRLMRQGVDPATRNGIVWHETLGALIFIMTAIRLVWISRRPPPPEFEMASWMRWASRVTHFALLGLLIALPITAILALGGEGHPLTLLGGVRIDKMPVIANARLAHIVDWGDVHGFLGNTIMWLAALHAVAALVHHFVLKDGVLLAMLPRAHRPG